MRSPSRFGLVPNFFLSAPDAPETSSKALGFRQGGLFRHSDPIALQGDGSSSVSRAICQVRYCITRHCAFLLGYGHSAGDPVGCRPNRSPRRSSCCDTPTPWQRDLDSLFSALEGAGSGARTGPDPDMHARGLDLRRRDACVRRARTCQTGRAGKRSARAVGGRRFEHLMGLLAFIRTAHYWTVLHPDIAMLRRMSANS